MLSQKLKEYRNKNGFTQQDLASKLFVSRSAVAKWEQGNGLPNKDTLEILGQLLNCSKEELLNVNEAVTIIEKVEKSSKKKTIMLGIISIVLCIGIIIAIIIASSIYQNGKTIYKSTSPDNQILLTVYDKPQSSNRGYTIKVSGEYTGTHIKDNCDFIGLYWSSDSRYVIEEFFSYELNERYFEYADFQNNCRVNLQFILNEKIKSHYCIKDEDITKIKYDFIQWDTTTAIMLFNFDLVYQSTYITGYFWSTPTLTDSIQGLVEIKKIEN